MLGPPSPPPPIFKQLTLKLENYYGAFKLHCAGQKKITDINLTTTLIISKQIK